MYGRALRNAAVLVFVLVALPAGAEEVRVLAAGAVQAAVRQLEAGFSAASGHTLKPEFDTVGALRNRVLAGERVDVVILSEAGMSALEAAAKIDPASRIELGGT
ncbi:MAG TPA: substrate-binding domain-containing protein, partial [Hyphomicrobiaceae bacterium]|nr:substrate-binding domain-containing protein [Hyphomicrobiaceae bacterium]